MTAQEVDAFHKAKRQKNLKVASCIHYVFLFLLVLSIGHSLQSEKRIAYQEKQIEILMQENLQLLHTMDVSKCGDIKR